MDNEIIVVKQLPIIEEQLRTVQQNIMDRVNLVLAMDCNEDTYKEVKKARAELNAQYRELEARRKEVKSKVEAPYKAFEQVYKVCAGDIFVNADKMLAEKIGAVERGLKEAKLAKIQEYFNEYKESLGISDEYANLLQSGVNVTLSASEKSMKNQVRDYLDHVRDDLDLIDSQDCRDELLVEYRSCRNVATAMKIVKERQQRIAIEKARREAIANEVEQEKQRIAEVEALIEEASVATQEAPDGAFAAPVVCVDAESSAEADGIEDSQEKVYSVSFKVTGTLDMLKAMKKFLNDGGYDYEQL